MVLYMVIIPSTWNIGITLLLSHSVFLLSSNGMDVILRVKVLQYRVNGGTLNRYFFSGGKSVTSTYVIANYVKAIGTPTLISYWSLGFHLCRYADIILS